MWGRKTRRTWQGSELQFPLLTEGAQGSDHVRFVPGKMKKRQWKQEERQHWLDTSRDLGRGDGMKEDRRHKPVVPEEWPEMWEGYHFQAGGGGSQDWAPSSLRASG